jgi:hypothetical protein
LNDSPVSMSNTVPAVDIHAAEAILSTILYFDIFRHPLTERELQNYLHNIELSKGEIHHTVNFLLRHNLLFEKQGYILANQNFENIERRVNGEMLAAKRWPEAIKKSKLISRFPFVRAVIISGSLSKGFMDEKSDIDFLIITEPGRLWVARTFLALYKKIFLFNSHKFFCVNYFLDLENLILTDHNIFTATELLLSVPTYNSPLYKKFLNANPWAYEFYPALKNYNSEPLFNEKLHNPSLFEKVLNGRAGTFLEKYCMLLTIKFWRGKFSNMNRQQYARDMKNNRGVSKHHPNGFRDSVINLHNEKLNSARKKLTSILSTETFSEAAFK